MEEPGPRMQISMIQRQGIERFEARFTTKVVYITITFRANMPYEWIYVVEYHDSGRGCFFFPRVVPSTCVFDKRTHSRRRQSLQLHCIVALVYTNGINAVVVPSAFSTSNRSIYSRKSDLALSLLLVDNGTAYIVWFESLSFLYKSFDCDENVNNM